MSSLNKLNYFTSDAGNASSVEATDGIEEVLKSITSSDEFRRQLSIPHASAVRVIRISDTQDPNIKKSLAKLSNILESKGMSQPKKTLSFWKRIIRSFFRKKQ